MSIPTVRAGILSVGSELLLGDLTDTNATWLSKRLGELGIEVHHHLAARDELDELVDALRWLAARVEVVVIGGGLGPTRDDLTREAVAAAAGVGLEHRDDLEEEIRQRFAAMGRRMAPANLRQARVPVGARAFGPAGTAPGFALDLGTTRLFALPGVPWELRELFHAEVAPELLARAGAGVTVTRRVRVVGRGESDVAGVVEPLLADRPGLTLAFLAHADAIEVRLTVHAGDLVAARTASQPAIDEVVRALGPAVAGVDDETLEDAVLRLLVGAGQGLACAESATAGDIAARLGRVPGASRALRGGVVVYATDAKHRQLGVDAALLATHGPVSAPVTEALARGVRERFATDWGLAVTGVAGPDPVGELAVGTGFWALAGPSGGSEVHGRVVPGDRRQVIARLGSAALDLLRRRLLEA